jgi:hypothetical protein
MGRVPAMNALPAESLPLPSPLFEMRFASLFRPGRALSFPCDRAGHVDMDALSDQARDNYLYARATVGCEHALPCVCQREPPELWLRH